MFGTRRGGWWVACLVGVGCGDSTTGTVADAPDAAPDVVFVPPDTRETADGVVDADASPGDVAPADAADTATAGDDAGDATAAGDLGDTGALDPDVVTADPDATDTVTAGDTAETTPTDATTADDADASVVDTSPPAPFCGDTLCNGVETCLDCADCACPELCGADLFLSDYLEGDTGFNKALEVANFTGRPIDLAAYAIGKITNGGDWTEAKPLPLAGTLAAGDALLVCHGDADPALLASCDLTSTGDAMQFNGNDAVGLFHNGVLIDAIGAPGDAPTGGFTAAGVANATKDHRLTRRPEVVVGAPDWAVGAAQWLVGPPATDGLGAFLVAATCAIQAPPVAQLNEVRVGAGVDDFVELAAGPAPVDLAGWRVVTTGGQYVVPAGASAMLAAGGLRALGRDTLGFGLGAVDIVWLYDAAGALQDVSAVSAVDIADGQSWGRLPDLVGPFQGLSRATPGAPNEDPDHWCGDGVCQADEDCVGCVEDCDTCHALPGELVVTELLADPTAGPEWLEVTSVATVPLELAGLVLSDDGTDFHALAPEGGSLVLAPGERVVLGSGPASYVGYTYAGAALAASDDALVLVSDGQVVDRVAWAAAPTPPGTAWSLDPTAVDATDNDLPSEWCAAIDVDPDGQLGTPGAANPTCDPPPVCGDTACQDGVETCSSCPEDCGVCSGCATGLFISEYVEGSSFNKAIEIANFTGATVDLGEYAIWKITNTGTWNENAPLYLSGTLAAGDVYVLCKSTASAAVLALCDLATGQTQLDFNGDDAVGLAHGATLVDAIGTEASSGLAGGFTVAGVANAAADHTLIRKPSVRAPTVDWATSSDSEWQVRAKDDFSDLGKHTVDYVCP